MDIKLRARLTAYSKVDSIEGTVSNLPTIDKEHIDSLFDSPKDRVVTKEEIDTLFDRPENIQDTKIGTVSYSAIDSLFSKRK